LARSLKAPVNQGAEVVQIVQTGSCVSASWIRGNECQQVSADWLICTAPLGVLTRIAMRPPLSARKQDAIRRLSYDSATKVLALTRRRFWESDDDIFGGGSVSDGILGSTWYPSDNEQKDPEISAAPSIWRDA
jgi:monoamine oxidase